MKVICSNLKCKFKNENTDICECKKVVLTYSNIATVNQGRKDILECKSFEIDEEYARLKEKIEALLKDSDINESKNN